MYRGVGRSSIALLVTYLAAYENQDIATNRKQIGAPILLSDPLNFYI